MPSFHTARSRFVQRVVPVLLTALFFFALFFHKLPFSRKLDSTVRKRRRRGGGTLPLHGDGVEPGIVGNFSRYLQLTSNNRRCPKWIYHKSVNFRKNAATRRYVSLSLQHSSITAENYRCANSGRLLLLHKDYMPLAEVVTRLHKAVSSYRLSIMFARHLSKFRDDYFASVFSDTRTCGGFVFEKGSFVVFGKTSTDAAGKEAVAKYTRVMLMASRKRICMYTALEEGATSRTNRKEQDTLMVSKKQVDILASMISLVPFPASSAEIPMASIGASGAVSDRIQVGREGPFIESTAAAIPVPSVLPSRSKSVEITVSFPSKFPMSSSPSQRPFGLEPARISFGAGSSDISLESESVVSASKASRIPEFYFSTLPPALLPSGSFGLPSAFAIPSASARFSRASFSPNRGFSIFASVLPRASANTTSSASVSNSVDQSPLFSGSNMSILPLESQMVFESPVVSSMQSVSVGNFSSQLPTHTPLMSFSELTLPQGRMPSESSGTSADVMPDASSMPDLAPSPSSGASRPAPTITPSASFSMTVFLPSPGLSPSLALSPSRSPFVQSLSQSPALAKSKDLPLASPSFFMTPSAARSVLASPSRQESPQIETSVAYSPHLIPAFPRELPRPSPPLASESPTGSMSPSRSMFPSASISASSSMSSSLSVSPSRSMSASSSMSTSLSVSPNHSMSASSSMSTSLSVSPSHSMSASSSMSTSLSVSPSHSMSASSSMSTSLSVSPSHSMSPSTSYEAASVMSPSHSILASLSVSPTVTRTPSPSMSLYRASSSALVSKQGPQSSLSVAPSRSPRATPSVKMSSVPEFSSETDLLSSEPEISGKSFDLSKVSQSQIVMESTFPMPSMSASASIKSQPATPTPTGPVRVKRPSPSSSNPVVGIKRDIADTGSSCFSRFAEVSMADGGLKRMEELRIGDIVQIGMGKTGKIYGFSHLHREVRALFSKVETANRSLTATPSHHVLTDRGFVAAGSIRKGYNLILNNGQTAPVLSVSTEISKGLYNPHTFDGTIVVDGFICSTYTSTIQLFAAHSLLAPFRFLHHSGFRLDALRWLLDVTGAHTIVRVLSALLARFSA